MYCSKCGTQNADDISFCSKCGNNLKSLKTETERKGITGKLGKMGIPGFRSGKSWKMGLAFIGYFFIFMILLAIISPTNSDKNASPSTPQTQNSQASQPTAKLGDKIIAGDFAYTFNDMTKSKQIGENVAGTFFGEKADGTFIILDVTIENIGKESNTMLIGSYVKILDDQGRKFEHDSMAEIYLKEEAFTFTQLQPGLPKRGKIVFDVPENLNGKIELSGGVWSSDKKYVLLTK